MKCAKKFFIIRTFYRLVLYRLAFFLLPVLLLLTLLSERLRFDLPLPFCLLSYALNILLERTFFCAGFADIIFFSQSNQCIFFHFH